MADNTQSQLILAQNEHALVQDATKGVVQVYTGPHALSLSQADRPVVYDRNKDAFVVVDIQRAIKQNPLVGEGEYLVLENPYVVDGVPKAPKSGGNGPADLHFGSKINIPGPVTFPLWPGQFAAVVPGHHLHSDQYLIVRVYNAEEAQKNATPLLRRTAGQPATGSAGANSEPSANVGVFAFTPGQLLVIKGTEASFFIPPTGFEVLKEGAEYVREALTLERLEYAILLDEDGNKRYERGPLVVFPEATEKFMTRKEEGGTGASRKFKVIELNDQMGLYVKVIADYEEEVPAGTEGAVLVQGDDANSDIARSLREPRKYVRRYVTGEELFITGRQQRIYYPRPEHALIGYDDPKSNFKRERYYGITIPKGEGRYVLDKNVGDIAKVVGPMIFLPDPRFQVIVRRVLDGKTTKLWYPGNAEADAFNASLRTLAENSSSYLADNVVLSAAADISRSINRMTSANVGATLDYAAPAMTERITRGGKFTPPPMLTLSSKYDGVPTINVWTGYAVQVVNKSGGRRVVVGPATVLLEYDETLEMLTMSTGRPKNTDKLITDAYLRVESNLVSDEVTVNTKDLVDVKVKLSYRVNFLHEHQDRWFSVENYVKYLCDHMRSLLKAQGKKVPLGALIEDCTAIVRDVVLGTPAPAASSDAIKGSLNVSEVGDVETGSAPSPRVRRHRLFQENGMDVYDVEVLGVEIADKSIAKDLWEAQSRSVQSTITLAAEEQNLKASQRRTEIQIEMLDLAASTAQHTYRTNMETNAVKAGMALATLESTLAEEARRRQDEADQQEHHTAVAKAQFERTKQTGDYALSLEKEHSVMFKEKMATITPQLIQAMLTLGQVEFQTRMSESLAPLALYQQQGLSSAIKHMFKGTVLEPVFDNIEHGSAT